MQIMSIDLTSEDGEELMREYLPEDVLGLPDLTVWSAVVENLIVQGEAIAGFLAFVQEESGIRIVYIYVEPVYRGLGIANGMLDELTARLAAEQYAFPVTLYLADDQKQKPLLDLIVGRGDFFVNPSTDYIMVSPEQMFQSAYAQKLLEYNGCANLLFSQPLAERRRVCRMMQEAKIPFGDGILSDGESYIGELCYCHLANSHIDSLCLVKEAGERELELSLVYALEPKGLGAVLAALTKSVRKNYPEYSIAMAVVNQNSKKLADGFWKDVPCEHRLVYCAMWSGLLRTELERIFTEEEEE